MYRFDNCVDMLEEWTEELSIHCGRPASAIASQGLRADDFSHDVELGLGDTVLYFRFAFCLVNESKGLLAVFSEHAGYHVFPAYNAWVCNVRKEWVYNWSDSDE